jgi:hypothetical protein
LSEAIRTFEDTRGRFDEVALRKRAALFGEEAFLTGFEAILRSEFTNMQASSRSYPALRRLLPAE